MDTVPWTPWRLFRTWLPTALGSSMLVAEIPVVSAFVARSEHSAAMLAAFGICVAIIVVLNSPALAFAPVVVGAGGGGATLRRYVLWVGLAGCAVCAGLAVLLPGAGPAEVLHVDGTTLDGVRDGLLALVPAPLAVALRRYLHGRLILSGRTAGIGVATLVRLGGSGVTALVATQLFPGWGAGAGAAALTVGSYVETLVLATRLRRTTTGTTPATPTSSTTTRPVTGAAPGLRAIVRLHVPLGATRLLNMAPQLITVLAVGRSAEPALSLAVWPTVYGLLALFTGPTADLESVTAAHRPSRPRAVARLAWYAGAGFTAAFAVAALTPVCHWYVTGLVGVPPAAAAVGVRWMFLLLPAPALWVARSSLRGVVVAEGATPRLVGASGAHVAALVVLCVLLPSSGAPGVVSASIALIGGLVTETGWTAWAAFRAPGRAALAGVR